jgi:transcription elongation factor Elf1
MDADGNMDCDDSLALAGIAFSCPHCGARESDDLELLATDEIHAMTCGACVGRYFVSIAECTGCGEEAVLTWGTVPTPQQIRGATCARCGKPLSSDDDDIRTMGGCR